MDQDCSSGSSAPGGSVVQVCFPSVRAAVLDSLNRQREEGRLCDLSIQVQGQVFRAHRCVLAASSPYFHDQVLLKNVTTVSLPSVMDPLAFESVLSSAYTGQLSIVRDDIVNYVTVASFLQMWHIVDKCTEILKRPRAAAGGGPGGGGPQNAPSRQQSPSSTDCLYAERERERGERPRGGEVTERDASERDARERGQGSPISLEKRGHGQDQGCLPPLASWRRPQQLSRWGRSRPLVQPPQPPLSGPPQSSADSQLDPSLGAESDYSSCEEIWLSGSGKASPRGHEGGGGNPCRPGLEHPGRAGAHSSSGHTGEAGRQRLRPSRPKGPPQTCPTNDFQKFGGREPQGKRKRERGTEADEGMGETVREDGMDRTEKAGHSGEYPTSMYQGDDLEAVDEGDDLEGVQKEERDPESNADIGPPHGAVMEAVVPGPSCPGPLLPGRMQWQASPWLQPGGRPLEGEEEDDDDEEEEVDFGRFADESGVSFGGQTYDEIEDGTGQVSQRPLVPASPNDDGEYLLGPPELSWPPPNIATQGPGGAIAPSTSRHLSPSSAPFPPSSSPPIPSSSSLSLAGAPYTGKVHFCHCGKAYTLKSMRDRHVKMQHLNLRPFACPVCAKTFKMKHHLTKHLKTHGSLRPYECGLCGKKVIWRDSFLRHQARCERLAAAGMPPGYDSGVGAGASSNDAEDGYGYGFEEGEGFLSEAGQVKVEEADFQGEAESAMGGLLGGVSAEGLEVGTQARTMGGQGLKEEADRYS
ncbi:zinc finger and BTB domain-containing protein 22 [Megalops cyprinoides]|uniref:zinc finger and BTB domain-containing protein 22 n=1 Tax=Megalops cyprinoides TaxID=118141 RepID=UPI0018644F87|nr:zinc finger and BTB domain-containing protein 22 [Megalops cyprinoides]